MNTLITGSSSGIGAALAEECARRGDTLFICARDAGRLDAVVKRCLELGAARCEGRTINVADEAAMDRWIRESDASAPLDLVIANAGVGTGEETSQNVRATFATNVGGVVNTVLPAIEAFRRRKAHGAIVMISSMAGYGPLPSCPSYSATKACVKTWGLSLRGMLRKEGIRITVVCPGFVRSRITDRNTCPMPFFMEAPKAAQIILRGVARGSGLVAFPWPMRLATYLLSILPYRLGEAFGRLLPEKRRAAERSS